MKNNKQIYDMTNNRLLVLLYLFLLILPINQIQSKVKQQQLVSYVDTSLEGSQKYVLYVDGKPFYMTNMQIRLDKLRYWWGWDAEARDAIVEQAAMDGFNTVSIPIQWVEVEPEKDKFDWRILDEYLELVNKYSLRMELLWFGQNSGGHVQWLGNHTKENSDAIQLRTPSYILHSPSVNSPNTTSEFKIRRDMSNYTLDLADEKLKPREIYVLKKVMEHIAEWDAANGSKHTVIGVQINNEVSGHSNVSFPSSLIVSYMSDLAGAVKNSSYVVWTRLNCIPSLTNSIIMENENLRSTSGTNIDFVGIDLYRVDLNAIKTVLPYIGKNYRMIMEGGGTLANGALYQMAALAGNNAYDYYEMIGPDENGLYRQGGQKGFTARGRYVEDVRLNNKILKSDMADIARKANGYGLFVHNWEGNCVEPTSGIHGIRFAPGYPTSQGISIDRSNTEIVLMTTRGGQFVFPKSLKISEASRGYFDNDNKWIEETKLKIDTVVHYWLPEPTICLWMDMGWTVRLKKEDDGKPIPAVIIQGESADLGGGVTVEANGNHIGFAGNGYLNFPLGGGYANWINVDGLNGGERLIKFRYANGTKTSRKTCLYVNGIAQVIEFPPTGSWGSYGYVDVYSNLKSGKTNTLRLETTWHGAGNIDEIHIF